jgi:hypothetical protein
MELEAVTVTGLVYIELQTESTVIYVCALTYRNLN